MADSIQIKRGAEAAIPALADGELGYCTDSEKLYIGTGSRNVQLAANSVFSQISTLQADFVTLEEEKLTAVPAESQLPLDAETATAAGIAEAFNSLLEALKTAGIMNT